MADEPKISPRPTRVDEPFWEGLQDEEIRVQQCSDCDKLRWYPRVSCPNCYSHECEWVSLDQPTGQIYTYTVPRQKTGSPFDGDLPYIFVVVEWNGYDDLRMGANLVDTSPDEVEIGLRVKPYFDHINDEVTLLQFQPA